MQTACIHKAWRGKQIVPAVLPDSQQILYNDLYSQPEKIVVKLTRFVSSSNFLHSSITSLIDVANSCALSFALSSLLASASFCFFEKSCITVVVKSAAVVRSYSARLESYSAFIAQLND